ncbi:MAG: hypothetical protein H6619_04120 [Deltaproteobacteria bacterium]|nr:hypothetical protein [Deltaproteobacteria bacterium]
MEQVGLNIVPRLRYTPENFVFHSGTEQAWDACISQLPLDSFQICYLHAANRYGKTHFSIALSDWLAKREMFPKLMDGLSFEKWLLQNFLNDSKHIRTVDPSEVIIVDDADLYFDKITPGLSGPFVNFVETYRTAKAGIVFLSSKSIDALPCDNHVISRLKAGAGLSILAPSPEELPKILSALAKQRGVKLTERNILFLEKRLARDITSLEHYLDRLLHLSQALGKSIKFRLIADAV